MITRYWSAEEVNLGGSITKTATIYPDYRAIAESGDGVWISYSLTKHDVQNVEETLQKILKGFHRKLK